MTTVAPMPLARQGAHKAALPVWADAWWCYRLPPDSDEMAWLFPDTLTLAEYHANQAV